MPGFVLLLMITHDQHPRQRYFLSLCRHLEDKGIKKGNVFFLFASGSHRLMNEEEKRARLSDEIFENYRSIDHPFYHPTLHHLYTFNKSIFSRIFLLAHVKNEQAMPEKLIRHTKA